MPRARGKAPPAPRTPQLDCLFAQEVKRQETHARQQAVQAILSRRELIGPLTVAEYLAQLQRDAREMWDVIAGMEVLAFADSISNTRRLEDENRRLRAELSALRGGEAEAPARRTRLSPAQKDGLKQALVDALAARPDGLARAELAANIPDPRLRELGLSRRRLQQKLRIPLQELVRERRLRTLGEKRLTRYLLRDVPPR